MSRSRRTPTWALPLLMLLAAGGGCGDHPQAAASVPAGVSLPDPTQLPVATPAQVPLTTAYDALNVPTLAAGSSYQDPTTSVRVYKLTSSASPAPGSSWGHDYSEGGDEVSLPYAGNTRAVLMQQNGASGGPWWIVDFTPGSGVGNPRRLAGNLAPWTALSFTFSNNPATPYYAYVAGSTTIRRFDVRSMSEAPGNGWPVTDSSPTWLHQSEKDAFFVWLRGANGDTIVGYEPSTGAKKTYTDAGLNEPRVDRAGRYVGVSMNKPPNGLRVWDWLTNTVVWSTGGDPARAPQFAHVASLKDRWMGVNWGLTWPGEFTMFTPTVPDSAVNIGGPANGSLTYGNGNWIQSPASPEDQWALFSNYGSLAPTGAAWLAPGGMIFVTANGERRLLGHPYNTTGTYNYMSFPKASPDGRYVLFTSDMNGSGRTDLFLAELPQSRRQP
jgi:hypothetical protein